MNDNGKIIEINFSDIQKYQTYYLSDNSFSFEVTTRNGEKFKTILHVNESNDHFELFDDSLVIKSIPEELNFKIIGNNKELIEISKNTLDFETLDLFP
ncbi:hypothetical protein [Acinetobacter calcoaceticus]|uniref:hypothetical protein n=1 Tax=Acinetobacter calcoaceticus TaxID=471 RepID=UPI00300ABDAB